MNPFLSFMVKLYLTAGTFPEIDDYIDDPSDVVSVADEQEFLRQLHMFKTAGSGAFGGYQEKIFKHVALPLAAAWKLYKENEFERALDVLECCKDEELRRECVDWILKRSDSCESLVT